MKAKPQMSLAQMTAKSASANGRLACPTCGCADFKTYGTIPGYPATFRYKRCRHCGWKGVTVQDPERIVRNVESPEPLVPDEDEIEGDSL